MRVHFLGPIASKTLDFLSSVAKTTQQETPLDLAALQQLSPDLIVSHGYRHLIRSEVIQIYQRRILNLHISMLPWNRGADPNFWSILDATPKGVSIHEVDVGLDTGPLLFQKEVIFDSRDTLKTSYEKLQAGVLELLVSEWPKISTLDWQSHPQAPGGTSHRKRDLVPFQKFLAAKGFETFVQEIEDLGVLMRSGKSDNL